MLREKSAPKHPGADPGEQDQRVELSVEKTGREREGFLLVFQGDFAHGWRNSWLPALLADEGSHLLGAAAFEREDAETVIGHVCMLALDDACRASQRRTALPRFSKRTLEFNLRPWSAGLPCRSNSNQFQNRLS